MLITCCTETSVVQLNHSYLLNCRRKPSKKEKGIREILFLNVKHGLSRSVCVCVCVSQAQDFKTVQGRFEIITDAKQQI